MCCELRAATERNDTRRLRHRVLFGAVEEVWTDVDNFDQSSSNEETLQNSAVMEFVQSLHLSRERENNRYACASVMLYLCSGSRKRTLGWCCGVTYVVSGLLCGD